MESINDWRSAVDATTGKTYWYHRITRQSQWTKPNFIEDQQSSLTEPSSSTVVTNVNLLSNNQNLKPQVQAIKQPSNIESNISITKSNPTNELYKSSMPNSIPKQTVSKSKFRFSSSGIEYDDVISLQALAGHINETEIPEILRNSELISDLSNFLFLEQKRNLRILTLQILWKLSSYRTLAGFIFFSNQSWVNLWKNIPKWDDHTSTIILSAFYSNLMIGPTFKIISDNSIIFLRGQMEDISNKLLSMDSKLCLLINISFEEANFLFDKFSLQLYSVLASKGHELPALLLVVLSVQSLRSEKIFIIAVKNNILTALQSIYISKGLSQETREKAKSCLQSFISSSNYIRDKILNCYLDLITDINSIPTNTSVSPLLYSKDIYQEECDLDKFIDDGFFEIKDNTPIECQNVDNLIYRDVDWIPKSGIPWKFSSVLLWTRCPGLRDTIQDFWIQGGQLELAIEVDDDVILSLCQYIHNGLYSFPAQLSSQLELLKLTFELGLKAMQNSCEEFIEQNLTNENAILIIEFCNENNFPDLFKVCNSFLKSGKHSNNIRLQIGENNPNNISLKNAIFESLQDVNHLLHSSPAENPSIKKSTLSKEVIDTQYKSSVSPLKDNQKFEEENLNYDTSIDNIYFTSHHDSVKAVPSSGPQKASKAKSGGIYGLLLQQSSQEFPNIYNEDHIPVAVQIDKSKVPGKVVGEHENIKKSKNSLKISKDASIQEFSKTMSLEPTKPKTEHEKRLDEMSKPKHLREIQESSRLKGKVPKERDSLEDGEFSNLDISNDEKTNDDLQNKISSKTKNQPKSTSLQTKSNTSNKNNQPKTDSVIVKKDPPNVEVINEEDRGHQNVRSSLALLKAKTNKSRLRPTVGVNKSSDKEIAEIIADLNGTPNSTSSFSFKSNTEEKKNKFSHSKEIVEEENDDYYCDDFEENNHIDDANFNNDHHNNHHKESYYLDSESQEEEPFEGETHACPDCGRKFATEPFAKHIKICKKVFASKRKVFDSSKMRIEGIPELKSLVEGKKKSGSRSNATQQSNSESKQSSWKEQSKAFREVMKAARNAKKAEETGEPYIAPSTPYIDPSFIQCPNCQRRFNSKAAERHIPLCKNIIAKPSTLRKGQGQSASNALSTTPKSTGMSKKGWN